MTAHIADVKRLEEQVISLKESLQAQEEVHTKKNDDRVTTIREDFVKQEEKLRHQLRCLEEKAS